MTSYVAANDPYAPYTITMDNFGADALSVSPSDTVDFASYPKAIVVTAVGNLVVLPLKAPDDGNHLITFTGVPSGFVVPFRVRRVMATGTTASAAAILDA